MTLFLKEHGYYFLEHPPYSPDIAPCDFLLKLTFSNISGMPSECQTVCIQIRSDVLDKLVNLNKQTKKIP